MRQTHLTNIIKQTNEAEQNKVDLQNKERPAVEQNKTKKQTQRNNKGQYKHSVKINELK